MKPILAIAAAIVALFSQPLFGQQDSGIGHHFTNPELIDTAFTAVSDASSELFPPSEADALQDDSGPGFQTGGRLMLRASSLRESPSGFYGEDPSVLDRIDSLEMTGPNFWTIDEDLQEFNGSIELMGQHLWDWKQGVLNRAPAARLVVQTRSFALDVGSHPFASQPAAFGTRLPTGSARWSFVNYFSYGLRATVDSSDLRYASRQGPQSYSVWTSENGSLTVGPQIALGRVSQYGALTFDWSVNLMAGYQRIENVTSSLRSSYLPAYGPSGGTFLTPISERSTIAAESFPFFGELRTITTYAFTPSLRLDLMANLVVSPRQVEAAAGQASTYSYVDFRSGNSPSAGDTLFAGNLFLSLSHLH